MSSIALNCAQLRSHALKCTQVRSYALTCAHMGSNALTCAHMRSSALKCAHVHSTCAHMYSLVFTSCDLIKLIDQSTWKFCAIFSSLFFFCVLNLIDGMSGPLLQFYCFIIHYFMSEFIIMPGPLFGFDFSTTLCGNIPVYARLQLAGCHQQHPQHACNNPPFFV